MDINVSSWGCNYDKPEFVQPQEETFVHSLELTFIGYI